MGTELENTGGIVNTLNIEFEKINSPFRVSPMLIVEGDKKVAEIDLDAKGKPSAINFWRYGVSLATASTTNIRDHAEVIDFWLAHDVTTHELAERYRFVYPTDNAKAFDDGTEVEYAWNSLAQNDRLEINEFVKLASKDKILSTLFPFTSLYTLCLSRCTGYPYDIHNLPHITPKQFTVFNTQAYNETNEPGDNNQNRKQLFVVTTNAHEYLGEGDAETALEIVKRSLPRGIKPAVKGTLDDQV